MSALLPADSPSVPTPIHNHKLRRYATYASVIVAVILIAAKLIAYLLTDSVAMLSSLLDSTVDLMAALVTVVGVASAIKPPDSDHRFGHGKAEPLTALAQAAFILGSAVLLGYEAINRLYKPVDISNEKLGYIVMAFAIVMTIILIEVQRFVVHRTGSMAIDADRFHYLGDLVLNFAVITSLGLHQLTGIVWIDPLFAIAISGGLIFGASQIAIKAMRILMDQELSDDERLKIKQIVESVPHVDGVHDMRTRSDSERIFIEMHVEMDGAMALSMVHDVSEAIEDALRQHYPNADILIHQDPAGFEEHRLDEAIAAQSSQIEGITLPLEGKEAS